MRIVFFGNCQASALRALYDRYVQPYSGAETFHIASHNRPTPADKALVASADLLAVQSQDFAAKAGPIEFPAGVPVHRFPVASGNFLWPFSGRERPDNKPAPGFPLGPFPAQMGDSYLNRLIREGRDTQQATQDYINLDVSTEVDLDRLLSIVLAKQKRLDDELGFQVAAIISDHFRDERLFRTSYHPETRIVVHLATTLFRHMGVDESILARIERWQRHPGLPPPECPIHPSVVRHFGLQYIDGSTTYRLHNEGYYPFSKWVARYLAGDWNRSLAEGIIHTGQNRPPEPTRALLEDGLALSPASGPGWSALSINYVRQSNLDKAVEAARKAAELEPHTAHFHAQLGGLLSRVGDTANAVQAYRVAWELDPAARSVRRALPQVLTQFGDVASAIEFVQGQIADPIEPPGSELYAVLARLLERSGDRAEALRIAEVAATMAPPHVSALLTFSDQLTAAGRDEDAVRVMRQAVELRPDEPHIWFALSRTCHAKHQYEEAHDAISRAIELAPQHSHYHGLHARILTRLRRLDDADCACGLALDLRPADRNLLALRADIRNRIVGRSRQRQAEPAKI